MEGPALGDRDAFGVKTGPAGAVVLVFQVRHGRVVDRLELTDEGETARMGAPAATTPEDTARGPLDVEVLTAALQQFYAEREPPPEVHVPVEFDADDRAAFDAWLSERAGRRVLLLTPKRGEKRAMLDLIARNAALSYHTHFGEGMGAAAEALDELRVALTLSARPRRIECFDISTLHGRETVASMVVCLDGRMRASEYRKFPIQQRSDGHFFVVQAAILASIYQFPAPHPPAEADDCAAMHEVVLRRYRRLLEEGGPFPDLIIVDGGKGQLTAAYDALRELGLERLMAVGLAKQVEGLALPHETAALRLMQRIRDEAHRFAVTFHRRSRTTRDLHSALDDIKGIGPRRRRQLLQSFGSVAGVRRASREALAAVVGAKAAEAVIRHFV